MSVSSAVSSQKKSGDPAGVCIVTRGKTEAVLITLRNRHFVDKEPAFT